MKRLIKLLILLTTCALANGQPFIQGSIQQGSTPNSVNILYLPNHTSTAGEYVNYLSISIAIPLSSATSVTPTISGLGNFAPLSFTPAQPFSYTQGTEKIFSWICPNGTPLTMSWTNAVSFFGVTITFTGGTGSSKIRLVDFTNLGGGTNSNTFFNIGVNVPPFDLTNYLNMFYTIADPNGSTIGTYPNADHYVETNLPINLSALCPAPAAPLVSNITTTTADINWIAIPGISAYEYALITNPLPPASGTAIVATTYSATALLPGTQYYFHVRSDCGGGNFSQWTTVSFTTIVSCPAPATAVATNITTTSADLNWDPVIGAAGYEFELSTSAVPPASGTSISSTTFTASSLNAATTYYFHVRTDCGLGNFSQWTTTSFVTICEAPSTPLVLNITETNADINWLPVAVGVGGYEYFVSSVSTPPLAGAFTLGTNISSPGLQPGTLYYVYLRSACSSGDYSAWVFTTFITPCKSPLAPLISNINGAEADISWLAVSGTVVGYEYAITEDSIPPAAGTFTPALSYHATGLNSFTTYYVHLRTSCGSGENSGWVRSSFSTGCFKPVLSLLTNNPSPGTVTITWNNIHGAINYEYAVLSYAASPGGSLAYTVDTTLDISGLRPGGKYYLHVRTHCGPTSLSDWSIIEFHVSGVSVNPNPVNDIATITVYGTVNNNDEVQVFDAIGRIVQKIKLINNTAQVNMRGLSTGVYFVRYGREKGYVTRILKR